LITRSLLVVVGLVFVMYLVTLDDDDNDKKMTHV